MRHGSPRIRGPANRSDRLQPERLEPRRSWCHPGVRRRRLNRSAPIASVVLAEVVSLGDAAVVPPVQAPPLEHRHHQIDELLDRPR